MNLGPRDAPEGAQTLMQLAMHRTSRFLVYRFSSSHYLTSKTGPPSFARILRFGLQLVAVVILCQSLSSVAEAVVEDDSCFAPGWSDSFNYNRHSLRTFGRSPLVRLVKGGDGDGRSRLLGGPSIGEDWRHYWDIPTRSSYLRVSKFLQSRRIFLPTTRLGRALLSPPELHHRTLLSESSQPERKRMQWVPRLRFHKQVHSGVKLPTLNMISACYSDWAVCNNGIVVAIDLSNRGLAGPIPTSFSHFASLESVNLKNNKFSGTIPPWLGHLCNLTTLDLSHNMLSGQISETLGGLRKLRFLDLSYNQLDGYLPEQISNMKSLVVMNLARNQITGPIPHLCGLRRVRFISLGHNNLNGEIPTSLRCLPNLAVLALVRNNLSGQIPVELSSLPLLRVLDLRSNQLTGAIPFQFGSLQSLQVLWLQDNALSGGVPDALGELASLESLQLSKNQLEGELPAGLGMLSSLRVLDLSSNWFNGSLPDEFSLLTKLEVMYVNNTRITGTIPSSFGNLVSLNILSLSSNNMSGFIPPSLGNLRDLLYLDLESNNLMGEIPSSLGHCVFLSHLLLSSNSLTGDIPASISFLRWLKVVAMAHNNLSGALPAWGGSTSPLLEEIILTHNFFSGGLPSEWGELSPLRVIAVSYNNLTGGIPDSLAQCKWLQQLWLDHNSFTGLVGEWIGGCHNLVSLSLASNRLEGPIPRSLSQCKLLQFIFLGSNFLAGEIPGDLGDLPSLLILSLSSNNLSGPIPPQLGSLQSLEGLDLDQNLLTGSPPSELMNLTSLHILLMGHNAMTGPFPAWVTLLHELQALDLSFNKFEGEVPHGFTNLVNFVSRQNLTLASQQPMSFLLENPGLESLYRGASRGQTYLFLAGNQLSGTIPSDFGRLGNLWVLSVQKNRFTGPIPASLGGAKALCHLDLSENLLNGTIPVELENLSFLSFFNVSMNRLTGKIPDRGQFDTFGPDSFSGNLGLCGVPVGLLCFTPPPTQTSNVTGTNGSLSRNDDKHYPGLITAIVIASALGMCGIVALFVWWDLFRRRAILIRVLAVRGIGKEERWPDPKDALSINVAMFEKFLPKLTLADLMDATDNFAIENVIGDGGFGTVYKATFQGSKVVAVKRLMGDKAKGEREFLAEMETLGKVKHSNIVPLLGYCTSGPDRLLIYDYMANGNLGLWLHTSARVSAGRKSLNWATRLKIAQGAVRGIAFLHHVCVPHIIHRDIKASNILLDADFNAYVSDFGLARLISAYDTHLSTTLAGTVGYIPPEYGQIPLASTRGDVYSFGVVLLEILTGRRPTDRFFTDKEDSDLISWVRHSVLQNKILDVFDPALILELEHELLDHVDRLVGGFGLDTDFHPDFFPDSSQGSSPMSPFFSPDVADLSEDRRQNGRRSTSHSASELRVSALGLVPPRRSLGHLSSTSSPATNARPSSSVGYSPIAMGFEGIPECRYAENAMKQDMISALGLAVWCTEDVASKRPTMLQACKLLETIINTRRTGDDE